jgi:hypothetical protein
MKRIILFFTVAITLLSCKPDEPIATYIYEAKPHYDKGYAEFYGPYYEQFNIKNNVVSLSLFSDSLQISDEGELSGLGQYLTIDDIFVPEGVEYLAEGEYVADSTSKPFTFYHGQNFKVDDLKIDVGASLYYFEKNKNFSVKKHISRGSFTVKITDSKHIITCNFVLSDSSKVEGSFSDTLPHIDYSTQNRASNRPKFLKKIISQ